MDSNSSVDFILVRLAQYHPVNLTMPLGFDSIQLRLVIPFCLVI
jgi:hypothetical protein